jgi:hypothetical protein
VSGVPIQTFSDRLSCLTIGTTLLTHTSTNEQCAACGAQVSTS